MLKLLMQQVALFVECLLELLDIRFERSKEMPNLKIQRKGVQYLELGTKDAVSHLGESISQRVGFAHCWLAILVVMWISSLSAIVAYEWTQKTATRTAAFTKAFALEQYQFTVAFSKECAKAAWALGQTVASQLASQWQAHQGSFVGLRGISRLQKSSLTFD